MFRKSICALLVGVFVLLLGASVGFAQEEPCWTYDKKVGKIAIFCDGRLNTYDKTAPVYVYYDFDRKQVPDKNNKLYWSDVVVGVEFWAVNSLGIGQQVAYVPVADITPALASTTDVQIFSGAGITLNYSPSGKMFWFTAGGYSFSWSAKPHFVK